MNINWFEEPPYQHEGWPKNLDSIMNPNGGKVTWPQLLSEYVIFWRKKLLPNYKDIPMGADWYKTISAPVRQLNQQTNNILRYFPHIKDEPLTIVAFKNWCRKNRPLTFGGYRKTRVNKQGKCLVTQAEKDVVIGVWAELEVLIKQRNILSEVAKKNPIKPREELLKVFKSESVKPSEGSIAYLIELENKLKDKEKDNNGQS